MRSIRVALRVCIVWLDLPMSIAGTMLLLMFSILLVLRRKLLLLPTTIISIRDSNYKGCISLTSILNCLVGCCHRIDQTDLPLARAGSRQPLGGRSCPGAWEEDNPLAHRTDQPAEECLPADSPGFGCIDPDSIDSFDDLDPNTPTAEQAADSGRQEWSSGAGSDRKDLT